MCWLQPSAQLWYYPTFLLLPLLLVAGIECFAGYHAWRFLIALNGGLLGFVAGAILGMLLHVPMRILFVAFAGGLAGAALFANIVPLGSFVFTLGSVASLTILLGRIVGIPPYWLLPLAALVGLAGAVAVLALHRSAMIAIAAVAGAQQIAGAWHAYGLPCDSVPQPDVVAPSELTLFLALTAAGLLIQFATSRKVHTATAGVPPPVI